MCSGEQQNAAATKKIPYIVIIICDIVLCYKLHTYVRTYVCMCNMDVIGFVWEGCHCIILNSSHFQFHITYHSDIDIRKMVWFVLHPMYV